MICLFKKYVAVPNRDHIFHIQFPEVWTQTDVRNHFRKFGPVFIRWIDNTSAFVSLNDRENAPILLKTIETAKGVKVISFAAYIKVNGIKEVYIFPFD